MTNQEKPKLIVAASNPDLLEITGVDRARDFEQLVSQHCCGFEEKPEWCVWGDDFKGGKTVIWWIRPSERDGWVARKIANYLTKEHRNASAEMTEYNKKIGESTPVYGKHLSTSDEEFVDSNMENSF